MDVMSICRVKCARCGLEATRIDSAGRGLTSVQADECMSLCAVAADARARGEDCDPLSVDCPHLKTATVLEPKRRPAKLAEVPSWRERLASVFGAR